MGSRMPSASKVFRWTGVVTSMRRPGRPSKRSRDVAGIERTFRMQRQPMLKRQQDHQLQPVHVLMRHGPDEESPFQSRDTQGSTFAMDAAHQRPPGLHLRHRLARRSRREGDGGDLIFRKGRDLRHSAAANGFRHLDALQPRIRYAGVRQADRSGISFSQLAQHDGRVVGRQQTDLPPQQGSGQPDREVEPVGAEVHHMPAVGQRRG